MVELVGGGLPDGARLLFPASRVTEALDAMALKATALVGGFQPIVLIVLTGGLYAGVWLTERLDFALEVDFVRVSRYRSGMDSGSLKWLYKPCIPPAGRTVLLVDDVWDEGITLTAIQDWLLREGASRVVSAALIWKERGSISQPARGPDVHGLRAGAEWLIGCGLDLDGQWRHLPAVYALPAPKASFPDRSE